MDKLNNLYQPSITDLELNEHRGDDKPVVYLSDAIAAYQAALIEVLEDLKAKAVMMDYLDENGQPGTRMRGVRLADINAAIAAIKGQESKQ